MQRRFCKRIVQRKRRKGQALFTEYISLIMDGGQKEMRFKLGGDGRLENSREISIISLRRRIWGERWMR